jgi:hypothetical protein
MEEQAKWDDGPVSFGVKPVTEYTFQELRVAFGVFAQKVEQIELKQAMFEQVAQQVYGALKARVDKLDGTGAKCNDDDVDLMSILELTTWAKAMSTKVAELDIMGDLRDARATKGIDVLRKDVDGHARAIEQLQSPTDEDLAKLAEAVLSVPLDKFEFKGYEAGIFGKVHGIEAQVMAQAEDIEEARADGE